MPRPTTGMLVRFDENRRADLLRERVEGDFSPFTDALSVRDWVLGDVNIALLSFSEETIDFICLARKRNQVVTSKNRIEFSSIVSLNGIPIEAIEARLSQQIQKHFIRVSGGVGGIFPPATWILLLDAIKAERPDISGEIDRLVGLLQFSGYRITGEAADILLQERDALGIALDIFSGSNKLRDRVLGEWAPSEEQLTDLDEDEKTARLISRPGGISSFTKGIPQQYLQEEAAIQHDLFNWPGMTPMHEAGVSVFESGDRRLEVIYANRNDLEHTLGVDLLYYNELFELFVLVQYKLMHEDNGEMLYRPNPQLHSELALMDAFSTSRRLTGSISTHEQFRLNDDGFMLKFVPQKGLKPASGELIKGMYVAREYMHFLLGPHGPVGPRGGSKLTFDNSPRYMTNSRFTAFVNEGWIGTRGVQSADIRAMLERFYETGRAVVVAREKRNAQAA
jgi:hypothetical protein